MFGLIRMKMIGASGRRVAARASCCCGPQICKFGGMRSERAILGAWHLSDICPSTPAPARCWHQRRSPVSVNSQGRSSSWDKFELRRHLPSSLATAEPDSNSRRGPHHDGIVLNLANHSYFTCLHIRTALAGD